VPQVTAPVTQPEVTPIEPGHPLARARDLLPSFFDPVEVAEFLPSTMQRAAELAQAGAPEGAIVLADHQTAGRGRLGRVWVAPPGTSLMLSVVLRPPLPPGRAWGVASAAGVALAEAAEALVGAGVHVALKWPNDLLVGTASDRRKAAGLLAESHAGGVVLLGMGVNVSQAPTDFPPELRAAATSLAAAAGTPVDRGELLAGWAPRFVAAYQDLLAGGQGLLAAWRARRATIGRDVRIDRVQAPPLVGRAVDVDAGGALVLRLHDGRMATVAAGDVEHLRPAR
jgi:BirA family transcriptional regulator, biotin operon repressor / biotin---[acetyl-CoA-carboxylase] ligase